MGNEFENREQRRKMKKSRAKSGKAKATRATAVMMAALMATSGMHFRRGFLHMEQKITNFLHLREQKAVEDMQQVDEDMTFMS